VALDYLSRGAKPPGWAIYLGIDHPCPWWTRSFMENLTFTRASLSDVTEIMMIMCVLVEDLLCQAVTGQIPVLKCLMSGVCGCLWLRPVLPSIKWHRYLRPPALWPLAQYLGYPWAWLQGAWAHAVSGREDEVDWANRW
jgi:hypothetical protein